MTDELCFETAVDLAREIHAGRLSARESMEAHLRRIERINPKVNAIVSMVPERAMEAAAAADERQASGAALGPLHGLPIAHKDLTDTAGVRTTYGSPIFRDHVPARDSLLVERLRGAGAIMLGKTNVPEFGTGSQTFNPIFGVTRNPYDLGRTAGGSSGGAGAALAARLLPIADGSDLGGSLRNPASYCNVVGFRTSGARVPVWPSSMPWNTLPVEGAMGRTVGDTALLLSAMAGPDPRSPVAIREDPAIFRAPLDRDLRGLRVAWAPDFGGQLPVEAAVVRQLESQRAVFEGLGAVVEDAVLDLRGFDEVFRTLRALIYANRCGPLLEAHRHQMKGTVVENTEIGCALTGADIARAESLRAELFQRTRVFFDRYDCLVVPSALVPPFDVELEWVPVVAGVEQPDYLGWMAACTAITATGHPAISVPAGFDDGLPVGMQIVGPHPDDFGLLQIAHAFEQATNFWRELPSLSTPVKVQSSGLKNRAAGHTTNPAFS